ncbi:MAG: FUSC family protein [Alphaproteobacteria bacterium]|nr:FUSC family protein [Alphaproteobacteria bacterium]
MIRLSTPVKESIKYALAVTIAYAIALYMGWEKPFWSAFAVTMVSLDTAGASFNKAALRLSGTVVAAAVALVLVALFPQDRWAFLLCLSLYVGFCTYMLAGERHRYFWFVSAFVTIVMIVDAAPADALQTFRIVVARFEENAMGILVYSVISLLIWPQGSRSELETASRDLAATQKDLYRTYLGLMAGRGSEEDSRPARLREVQLAAQIGLTLNTAETDTYAVWELRHQWRRFHRLSVEVMETLERWRQTFPQVQELDLSKALPNLDVVSAEINRRMAEVERLMAGQGPGQTSQAISLMIDQGEVRALEPFQKAAMAVTKTQLDRLESLSLSLLDTVRDIRGFPRETAAPIIEIRHQPLPGIDPDRLHAAATCVTALWIAFLFWVYLNPVGHELFFFMTTMWILVSVLLRQSPTVLAPGYVVAILVGGLLYVFVMPHLSGYVELGAMIFGVSFALFYLLWNRRLSRVGILANVNILMAIDNHQTYDFTLYANNSAAMLLSVALAVAIAYIPFSPRPEKVFLRLLRRYFRQAEFMLSRLALDRDERRGWAERWKMALYRNDLLTLPDKLEIIGRRLHYGGAVGERPEKIEALATSLRAIAYRIKDLMDAREAPHAELLVQRYHDDLRAWRSVAQEQCRLWAKDPAKALAEVGEMEARLAARMARLEARVQETYRQGAEAELSERDYENFFRYLGGLRGLSEAGIGFIRTAQTVDWPRWREARF